MVELVKVFVLCVAGPGEKKTIPSSPTGQTGLLNGFRSSSPFREKSKQDTSCGPEGVRNREVPLQSCTLTLVLTIIMCGSERVIYLIM